MVHVMLSRVQEMNQVFILDKLTETKIRTDKIALVELHAMNARSINKNPSPWNKRSMESIKVASLNCARLEPHIEDVWHDFKLKKADIIHLQETWVQDGSDTSPLGDPRMDYKEQFINVGAGKGLVTYFNKKFKHERDVKTDTFQITKFTSKNMDSIIGALKIKTGKIRILEG